MTLDEFEVQVISTCTASTIVVSVAVIGSGITWLRLRAYLQGESFIEAFFNEATQKIAFAHIQGGIRVFGADNTGGWHWHPQGAPEEHVPTQEPVTFLEFLKQIEDNLRTRAT